MHILLLLIGLALILYGADLLTDGAAALAKRLRMPEFLIGLTIVAVGTSMPELVVSVLSAAAGKTDMALGNVVGSNLFNTLVILGCCAVIRPIPYTRANIRRDIPFGILASLLLLLFASDRLLHLGATDTIGRGEGICMLLLYALFVGVTIRHVERPAVEEQPGPSALRILLRIVLGLAGLIGGGELFLTHATQIARTLGVSDAVIAITLVAGGTSLPELAASLVSLAKGRSALALGNVIGSNIANILLILGLSATIRPLTPGDITRVDLVAVLSSAVLLWIAAFTFRRKAVDRTEGILFLALYAAYLWMLLR